MTTDITDELNECFNLEINQGHINELSRQRDLLLRQRDELVVLVRQIPSLLISARLDEREGKQTVYNYDRAAKVCSMFP